METDRKLKKLYAIAARYGMIDTYISYIEYVVQGHSFSAHDLANKIYKAAMIKREKSIHEHASGVNDNTEPVAGQMRIAKEFASIYKVMFDYTYYLERLALSNKPFDINEALTRLSDAAITAYDMKLRGEIDKAIGITLIGGYHDAV